MLIGEKKIKRALLKNAKNLQAIHDEYYELKKFSNVVFDRSYVIERHKFLAKDIMQRYEIDSINELMFLLHRHCGKVVKTCEFCGQTTTKIKNRSGNNNIDGCACKGICNLCKKIYEHANPDGICYSCKPYDNEVEVQLDNQDAIRYRFLQFVGNHEYINDITNIEEAELMMDCAADYFHMFKRIAEDIKR